MKVFWLLTSGLGVCVADFGAVPGGRVFAWNSGAASAGETFFPGWCCGGVSLDIREECWSRAAVELSTLELYTGSWVKQLVPS